jgi:hypothetical protein
MQGTASTSTDWGTAGDRDLSWGYWDQAPSRSGA